MPPGRDVPLTPNADQTWDQMRRTLKKDAPQALVNAKMHIERMIALQRRFG